MNKLKLFFFTLITVIIAYFIADEVESRLNDFINDEVDDPDNLRRMYDLSSAIFWVILCMVVFIILYMFARFEHSPGFAKNFLIVWSAATLAIYLTILIIQPLINNQEATLNKDLLLDTFFETLKYSIAPSFAALYAIERLRD